MTNSDIMQEAKTTEEKAKDIATHTRAVVHGIRFLKRKLEEEILKKLQEFENQTNTVVEEVELRKIYDPGSREGKLYSVELTVKL